MGKDLSHGITENSHEILVKLAECRVLTGKQLSAFCRRSRQVIRKDMRNLISRGLIASKEQGYGRGQGRPEKVIFLTQKGIKFLKDEDILSGSARFIKKESTDSHLVDHHLLVNWFHIHLIQMERIIPPLSVKFLSSNSHALKQKTRFSIKECIQTESGLEESIEFIPDGVFALTYLDKEEHMVLLFFLEVDMGTEVLASENRNSKDIRQKIINYQALFRSKQYKRYGRIFNDTLNGFRLLFLANDSARMAAICRLVQEMPPSDFIWVTNQKQMFNYGLSDKIWARGGKNDTSRESIVGSELACESPVLDTIQ